MILQNTSIPFLYLSLDYPVAPFSILTICRRKCYNQEPDSPPPEVGGLGSFIRRNTSIPSLYLSKATL